MRTKLVSQKAEDHSGYGAGEGTTEYYEYECPCGNGRIVEEHDNIPGFRAHDMYLLCEKCRKSYVIDTSLGIRNWRIVRKEGAKMDVRQEVKKVKTQPYISRIHIENFRNFHSVDFALGEKQVIIGENAVGKSNLLYALQLILDPTLSERDRMLEESDFWDGLKNPMDTGCHILIEVYLKNFEDNKNLFAQLADASVVCDGEEALKITYKFFKKDAEKPDYSYVIYKGDDETRTFTYEDRKMLNIRVIKAIRDVEAEMRSARTSPLTQIIKQKYSISKDVLAEISKALDEKGADTLHIGQVSNLETRLHNLLNDMIAFGSNEFSVSLRTMNVDATKLLYEPYVRKAIQARYPWIIVDEYQDLGKPLHELILTLLDMTEVKVFAVGDADQSIYDFQGAAPDYLVELSQREDVSCIYLKNNYRSAQTIVDASEYILESSRGYIACGKLHDYRAELQFVECASGMEEQYNVVVEQVKKYHEKGVPYHEIAVLMGNNAQIDALSKVCLAHHIPTYCSKQKFRTTEFVVWLQSCAKWTLDKNSTSFDEIVMTWRKFVSHKHLIGDSEALTLKRLLFKTLTEGVPYKDDMVSWLKYIDSRLGIVLLFQDSDRYPDELDNYEKLLKTEEPQNGTISLAFLARLGIPDNQVVLSTRHSSKGLEFDVIIMLGMEKDSFPNFYDNTSRKIAEARRLCFVAVSRARKACVLVRSLRLPNKYGKWFDKDPSPFWIELKKFQSKRVAH